MPTSYNGQPGNVTSAASINIASSTNTNPIIVTVSGTLPASFQSGVVVEIVNHFVNTHANGIHPATVTGASTFTIPVAGNGVGGATGTVQALNMTTSVNIPNDGENCNQASVLEEMETAADRTQALALYLPQYKLASFGSPGTSIGGTTAGTHVADSLPPASWAQNSSNVSGLVQMQDPGSSTAISWILGNVTVGDIVEITLDATAQILGTAAATYTGSVAIGYQLTQYISSGSFSASLSSPSFGASKTLSSQGNSEIVYLPVHARLLLAGFSFTDGSSAGMIYFAPFCNVNGSASETIRLVGDYYWAFRLWRPSGFPQ